jgi:flagellar protein FlaF
MQHAAKAYGKTANQTAQPRELEANLLLKSAAQLQAIQDDWENSRSRLSEALTYNRKLWTIFVTSVTEKDSPLPREIRQNMANIGIFVMNQTFAIIAEPAPEKLGALININRQIAAGMLGR